MDKHLFYIAISIFAGLLFSYFIKPGMIIILINTLLIACLLFINRKSEYKFLIILALMFIIGTGDYKFHDSFDSKLLPYENKDIEIDMIILGDGNVKGSYTLYKAEMVGLYDDGKFYNYREKLIFRNYGKNVYEAGDLVKARGQAVGFINKRNFGDLDYSLYNKSVGVYNQFVSRYNEKIKESKNFRTIFLYRARKRLQNTINLSLPQEEAAFLNAIVLGNKGMMDEEELTNFQKTGLSHLLSVSGLHVSIIAFVLYQFFSFIKMDKKATWLFMGVILLYYVMVIGSPPPAVRALIMSLVVGYGKCFNKEYDLIASVSFAAIIMLLVNPMLIHNPGFIISFGCIYSIAFLYKPMNKITKGLPLPKFIKESITLSLAIQVGVAPILIYYFNYISIINVILNIFAIPLVFLIITIAFPGIIIGTLLPIVSTYILAADYYMIKVLLKIIRYSAQLPFAGIAIPSLPIYIYMIYYAMLYGLIYTRNKIGYFAWKWRVQIYIAIAMTIAVIGIKYITDDDLRIVVLDVGQGDSILITTPKRKNILIDGGGSSSSESFYYDVGSKITVPALRKLGVWRIDTIISSHIHDDHLEGLIRVAEEYNIKNLVLPRVPFKSENLDLLVDVSKRKGSNIFYVSEDDRLVLQKDIFMEVLFPSKEILVGTNSDENNNSIVTKLKYKNFTMMFTGDIEKEAERRLINKDIESVALKVAHHGSSTSSSKEFLNKVSPIISIISVGNNVYGHPSNETIKSIEEIGSEIYRTDMNGAVKIVTDGIRIKVATVR
ncbi:MAG: DNA internalization-related competence protein ComEC/Rec2 [Clostridiales bacterium]|nr:DNA internalization-related competence protein ComEC/Rec2 [Clostridiales bacterium]